MDRGAGGIREHRERDDADREEGRAGHAAQQLATEPADRDADDGPTRELDHRDAEEDVPRPGSRPRGRPERRRRRRG